MQHCFGEHEEENIEYGARDAYWVRIVT
jgi:hypothetical protein